MLLIPEPNAPLNMKSVADGDAEAQSFSWELSSGGFHEFIVFKLCYKRNQSHCELTTVANSSSLPPFNMTRSPHSMSHSISITDDGEYVISVEAQSGNVSTESNTIDFKKGLYKLLTTCQSCCCVCASSSTLMLVVFCAPSPNLQCRIQYKPTRLKYSISNVYIM